MTATQILSDPTLQPAFTMGEHGSQRFAFGMSCVHKLMQQDHLQAYQDELAPAVLLRILNDLASSTYQPAKQVAAGAGALSAVYATPNLASDDRRYLIVRLNAGTQSNMTSLPVGGVIFEDPFLAILAAHAIGYTQARLCVPTAECNDELWRKTGELVVAIDKGTYKPSAFFAEVELFFGPPQFDFLTIPATKLARARQIGRINYSPTTKLSTFQLYAKGATAVAS